MPLDAISTTTRRWTYTGDGVTAAFAYNNYIVAGSDLEVYLELIASPYTQTLQTLTTHYTVSGAGSIAGGNVTFVTPPASTHKVVIVSKVPNTQPSTFNPRRDIAPDALTAAYHRLAAQVQQLQARLDRTVRPADGDTEAPAATAAWRTFFDKFLYVNASGDIEPAATTDTLVAAAWTALLAATPARGDLIRGNSSLLFEKLARGALGTALVSDGVDAKWDYAPQTPSGFRLSLTTALAVTTADVTAAATLYMTPYCGNWVYIFDGTGFARYTAAELSLSLDSNSGHAGYHQSGKNFDAFAFVASGAVDIGTGPAWSSDTARGTGAATTELELYNGVYVNKNAITLRFGAASGDTVSVAARQATYIGSFRCTADGQTEDSLAKRFVFNAHNRLCRLMRVNDTTNTWTYTTDTYRQANGSAANQLDFLIGLSETGVGAQVRARYQNSTTSVECYCAIGLDGTSGPANDCGYARAVNYGANLPTMLSADYKGYPGLGRHYLAWLERSAATGTGTWYGDNGGTPPIGCITGEIFA